MLSTSPHGSLNQSLMLLKTKFLQGEFDSHAFSDLKMCILNLEGLNGHQDSRRWRGLWMFEDWEVGVDVLFSQVFVKSSHSKRIGVRWGWQFLVLGCWTFIVYLAMETYSRKNL